MESSISPPGSTPKAARVRLPAVTPWTEAGRLIMFATTTIPLRAHMTTVSQKTAVMEMRPLASGEELLAAAAMAAVPIPDSLVKGLWRFQSAECSEGYCPQSRRWQLRGERLCLRSG